MGHISHKENKIHRVNPPKISDNSPSWLNLTGDWTWHSVLPTTLTFESAIISFAIGIGLYFGLPFEPDWRIGFVLTCTLAFLYSVISRYFTIAFGFWRMLCLSFIFICLGLTRAGHHTQSLNTTFLSDYRQGYLVTGWIEAVEKSGKGFRWQLRVNEISQLRSGKNIQNKPLRVRIKADVNGFEVGTTIRIKTLMTAPPGPVVPGGYDPARRAYYSGFGGYGFAIGKAERVESYTATRTESASKAIARFRYNLADRIRSNSPKETSGLQAALLTGVRSYVPEQQTEALRIAGLAHVLAISGLHMGLLAGSGYFLATLGFAMIAPLSRRYDVRKFAALVGMAMATAYLLLSGVGVSTQRAYIMAIIVFAAILLDRRAFSIRSVALAAIITLFLHPESLTSAGFQMSFAAATALVTFYTYWRRMGFETYEKGFMASIKRNLIGLSLTSVVAGAATAGFGALHFNRIARYSLIGNILAMPVFTALVMPAALAALLALPFGLEKYPLWIMGQGIDLILIISNWVASLPNSLLYLPSVPNPVIALFGIGFAVICVARPILKSLGLLAIIVCVTIGYFQSIPDMRVSDTGKIAFWNEAQDALLVERIRTDRYGREQFIQRAGRNDVKFGKYSDGTALCDSQACRFNIKGHVISIVNNPEGLEEECDRAALIILTKRQSGPVSRRACQARLLDETDFKTLGATDVYVKPNGIVLKHSNPKSRRGRPWSNGTAPIWEKSQ